MVPHPSGILVQPAHFKHTPSDMRGSFASGVEEKALSDERHLTGRTRVEYQCNPQAYFTRSALRTTRWTRCRRRTLERVMKESTHKSV